MPSLFRSTRALAGILLTAVALRANDAQVIFNCASVRLHPATLKQLSLTYTLAATTAVDGTHNDEIGFSDNPDSTGIYATTFVLTDPTLGAMDINGDLDIPDSDANLNGIADFFESDRAVVNAKSAGSLTLHHGMDAYPGTVDMTWNRSAGTASGTCTLRLLIPDFGVDLTFTPTFEIYDYRGTYRYHVQDTNVVGTLTLTRLGAGGSQAGALLLTRIDQDELQFPAFTQTNEVGQVIQFYSSEDMGISLLRGGLRTNYFTVLCTDDGWPATATSLEYEIWLIHVFDANDSDHDGIADLSGTPAPSKAPGLAIHLGDQTLTIEITADPGRRATLEQSPTIGLANWTTSTTFTMTNAIQAIEVPRAANPMFWRARVE